MGAANRTREAASLFCTVFGVVTFFLAPCSQADVSSGKYMGLVDENGQDYPNVDESRVVTLDGADDLTSDDEGSGAVAGGSFLATEVTSMQTPPSEYSGEEEMDKEDERNPSNDTESPLCPQFCCTTNMSCFYVMSNATRKPEVECSCDGFSAEKNCVIDNKDIWEELVESEETSRGICIEFHMINALNETGYKINCHIEGVSDFTFTTVHWDRQNGTVRPTVAPSQEVWLHYRPCVLYIEVNSTKPPNPAGLNKSVELALQYIGTGLCFFFIGIIMTSCREVKVAV
ncbi:Hypp5784 [Branchiostoma lanceolatum]|uniref:Hypp5784 protein n=1 Tax=Branchiostoma lanceolatum TaxID=7740 RepID=A0A8J9VG63_BRALA|nr:Hypp5784 [Branchiostoma lanceolatum]